LALKEKSTADTQMYEEKFETEDSTSSSISDLINISPTLARNNSSESNEDTQIRSDEK
jgi:hypothetical protein